MRQGLTTGGCLALAFAAVSACGPFIRGSGPGPAVLIFHNESMDQATVYAVVPGSDFRRIGTVIPGQTDTLEIDNATMNRGSQVNIVVRRFAGGELAQSGPMSFRPGDIYNVILSSNTNLLNVTPAESDEERAERINGDTSGGNESDGNEQLPN